jgi:hypothetical protein
MAPFLVAALNCQAATRRTPMSVGKRRGCDGLATFTTQALQFLGALEPVLLLCSNRVVFSL